MSKVGSLLVAMIAASATFGAGAADKRYPLRLVKKIEIVVPSGRTAWEDKNFLDCSDVVLTEEDVRFALRHMRRVSERSFSGEKIERTGCSGGAAVTFKTGRIIVIGVEPTGRINVFESDAKLEPLVGGSSSYYDCEPCNTRKMALLKDALNRADERRFRQAAAEGKISQAQAEARLKALRGEREPKPSKN
jgi:hypothetical protein